MYLSKLKIERQMLLNRKSDLGQVYKRVSDVDQIRRLPDDLANLGRAIQSLDAKVIDARKHGLPVAESRFYVRLKRLHGHLQDPKPHGVPITSNKFYKTILSGNMRLSALLSLPVVNILEELAHFLLTSSFPFTEESFFIIIKKLTVLRYPSMARSAYHHLIAAGYTPTENPKEIPRLLRIASVINDKRDFHRILRSVKRSGISIDRYTYENLIIGFLKMGKGPQAVEQYHAMLSDGIQPSLSLLTYLLHDCGTHRKWSLGKEIWRMIKVRQLQGNLIPDKWVYYEMWRLCKRCARYSVARDIREEALEDGIDLKDIGNHPAPKRQPVRQSNKAPELLHYYDSFRNRNFQEALSVSGRMLGRKPSKRELINVSSNMAREEVQQLVMHREKRLRGYPKYLDAIGQELPPEPFKSAYGIMETSMDSNHKYGDEETANLIDEASSEFVCSIQTSEKLLSQHVVESRVGSRTKSTISKVELQRRTKSRTSKVKLLQRLSESMESTDWSGSKTTAKQIIPINPGVTVRHTARVG